MVGLMDLFQPLGAAAGFPFGAPIGDSFANDIQTGDIGGAPSWGKPPIPGGPGAAPGKLAAVNPGGVDIEPGVGTPLSPPGGKPIGLLRAGDDDFQPGAGAPPAGPQLLRAGLEGPQGVGRGIESIYPPAAEAQGPPVPPGLLAPGGGRSEGPPLATPQQAAAARVTPGTPVSVSGPVGAPDGALAADPALRTPYAAPGSPLPGGATAGPAAAAPGGGMLDKLKGLTGDKNFMGALGKLTGAMGGGGGGGGGDGGSSGSMGDPTQGARANASKLFESIMAGKGPRPIAPPPQLPPGILELFQRGM